VALVVAVSLAMIYSSYRAAVSSVEDEATSGLDTAAGGRRTAIQSFIEHEQLQLTAGLKGIYLGCGSAGMMNPLCATEDLRRLVRAEHARAARLTYGKKGVVTAGKFAVVPTNPPKNGLTLRGGTLEGPTFDMAADDPDGGLHLDVEFSGEVLPRDNSTNVS